MLDYLKSRFLYFGSFLMLAAFSIPATAQVKGVFYGADFGDSLATVQKKLSGKCQTTEVLANETPNFPLAENSEKHLICKNIKLGEDLIQEVAFAFGDDKLTLIEARGGAVRALSAKATSEPRTYMQFKAYFSELLIADTEADAVWLLSEESVHPNLFTWSNPYLPSNKGLKKKYEQSAENPEVLKFGGNLEELKPQFEKQCPLIKIDQIKKPWLPTNPKTQTQINCFGYEFAGFPRKIEAVFGDGILEMAWILTGKQEEKRVRRELIKAYGEPDFVSETWEAFKGWRIALRKDKPEVLVLSEKLVPVFKERFSKPPKK